MADPDRSLRDLRVDWPETPDVGARLQLAPRRRLRPLAVAVALALLALAIAFAVPPARSALLRFFGLGAVTIERVQTLPFAAERPLAAGLGVRVGAAEAERTLGAPFRPAEHGPLYASDGIVSTLLATPAPVLLSELGSAGFLKKFVAGATHVETVEVAPGIEGVWLAGEQHVVFLPNAAPRLAGNVLVWEHGGITYRLEGRQLTKATALRLAREITGTGGG
jgi:hypothetical protein